MDMLFTCVRPFVEGIALGFVVGAVMALAGFAIYTRVRKP